MARTKEKARRGKAVTYCDGFKEAVFRPSFLADRLEAYPTGFDRRSVESVWELTILKKGLWCAKYALANRMARGKATIPLTNTRGPAGQLS